MGHTAKVVSTAEAALDALGKARFDVILMDVNLPGLSGTAATRAIRAMADPAIAALPIIGISAHVQEADRLENLGAGMSAILPKPLSPEALLAALREQVPQKHALFDLAADMGAGRATELARLFLAGLPDGLGVIEALAEQRDFKALSRAAHQMKGAVGNFELPVLAAHLNRIESLAEAGPSTELDLCLRHLPPTIEQGRLALVHALGLLDASPSQAAR